MILSFFFEYFRRKLSKIPYAGKKKIKPIIIFMIAWVLAISTQLSDMYIFSEL